MGYFVIILMYRYYRISRPSKRAWKTKLKNIKLLPVALLTVELEPTNLRFIALVIVVLKFLQWTDILIK